MRDIRIAAAQFEHRDGDKAYNLGRIRDLSRLAAARGAEVVCFHECSITAYTFLQTLSRDEMDALAEPVPGGPSVAALVEIARETGLVVMAGLIEREPDGRLYKSYAVAGPEGFLTKFHKLHPFISPHLTPGRGHHVVEILGVKFGFLICYDNNLPENVRATALLGAEVIVMPHVTGCTPSTMPGRGLVDAALWENRHRDPARLRQEFRGPKGRGWLMRWLPARAWENGVFAVFANNIGRDHDTIKPGLAMILDPSGEVLVESHALDDDVVVALLTADAFDQAPGRRYLHARRPELYGKLAEPHPPGHRPATLPGWRLAFEPGPVGSDGPTAVGGAGLAGPPGFGLRRREEVSWRLPRVRITLRSSMALVAVAAVALLVIRLIWPPPRYRYVEVFYRSPSGSINGVEMMTFDLDRRAPPSPFGRGEDGETRYRRQVEQLKATKAEYKVTSAHGFDPHGKPIP